MGRGKQMRFSGHHGNLPKVLRNVKSTLQKVDCVCPYLEARVWAPQGVLLAEIRNDSCASTGSRFKRWLRTLVSVSADSNACLVCVCASCCSRKYCRLIQHCQGICPRHSELQIAPVLLGHGDIVSAIAVAQNLCSRVTKNFAMYSYLQQGYCCSY